MLTVFMDYRGVVHYEFLPEGQTVNKEYYLGVMRRLHEAIRQKRPDLWANNSWVLHYDNAPSHIAIVIRELLAKNETNKKCFEDWIKRWHKCVAVDGVYFEGDNINYDE